VNIFELEIWDDEAQKCTFYTVREDGAEDNETDIFFNKYDNDATLKSSTQELLSFVLLAIGDRHGAVDELFNRNENQVDGLPSQGKIKIAELDYHYPNFPLRLYALKISEGIVVLFNGGIKDGDTNQTSSLHYNWVSACNYATRITEALSDGTIVANSEERTLTMFDGSKEILL
jgi:hypothetical protein